MNKAILFYTISRMYYLQSIVLSLFSICIFLAEIAINNGVIGSWCFAVINILHSWSFMSMLYMRYQNNQYTKITQFLIITVISLVLIGLITGFYTKMLLYISNTLVTYMFVTLPYPINIIPFVLHNTFLNLSSGVMHSYMSLKLFNVYNNLQTLIHPWFAVIYSYTSSFRHILETLQIAFTMVTILVNMQKFIPLWLGVLPTVSKQFSTKKQVIYFCISILIIFLISFIRIHPSFMGYLLLIIHFMSYMVFIFSTYLIFLEGCDKITNILASYFMSIFIPYIIALNIGLLNQQVIIYVIFSLSFFFGIYKSLRSKQSSW